MSAQTSLNGSPTNSDATVCISQSAANKCFDCFNEAKALRTAVAELDANRKLSEKERSVLLKKVDDLETNHELTVAEHKKETAALRKIIEKLSRRRVSFLWGLIKFNW